ncbi:MAG: beta-galactosidase [Candidatus Goldiibacteriota bacterium HGW-Goldbacteria-1]|jgi:beta-mannosidase|nr:MAG: beta-galactosidase [Candidatus Goldiibacteriota bacterium HGW-Goldbacteria-1]
MKKQISLNGIWDFRAQGQYRKIKVPSNWYLQGCDFAGRAEYSRKFTLKKKSGKKYKIAFKGVDYFADVYINGKFAGSHEGYFQHFNFDATAVLRSGSNEITLKVNSPKEPEEKWPDEKYLIKGIFNHHDARPGSWSKKYGQDKNTGGIWNDVYIEETDEIEICRIKITPCLKDDGIWNVGSEIIIENSLKSPVKAKLAKTIKPETFKGKPLTIKRDVILYPGKNTFLLHTDIAQPHLWWTWDFGTPDLYNFSYSIAAENGIKDTYADISGIKELKKGADNLWYLNGKRIFLRGSNIIPTQWLSEYTEDKIKKDVKMMKEANLNTIRVHAHVNREELYREFDRQGIMIWQDFALQWSYETTPEFMENASRQIKDMINLHYNRPSIAIWCCHNEPSVNAKQLDPVLYRKAREEDSVRYIEQSSDFKQHPYQGWYYDSNFITSSSTLDSLKDAFINTEYGAQALPCMETMKKMEKIAAAGMWPPDFEAWEYHDFQFKTTFDIARVNKGNSLQEFIENSQQYQADYLKEQTETFRLQRYKSLNGLLQFMFCECWPSITWAVVDYYRNPKKGYYQLKESMQPVLPGFRLFTTRIAQGDDIGFGQLWSMVFIINDTLKTLTDTVLKITLTGPDKKEYFSETQKLGAIMPDSLTFPFQGVTNIKSNLFKAPENAILGRHTMNITLNDSKGKVIGVNSYSYEIVKSNKRGNN